MKRHAQRQLLIALKTVLLPTEKLINNLLLLIISKLLVYPTLSVKYFNETIMVPNIFFKYIKSYFYSTMLSKIIRHYLNFIGLILLI